MKLLTFLGMGNYLETVYQWKDKTCRTCYAPVASTQFLTPDEVVVFVTGGALQHAYPALEGELKSISSVRYEEIPLGGNEEELWEIFDRVSRSVSPKESVAFDITHGLRSFPLVGLLVAGFLRSGLDVDIRAVLYGAYDAGKAMQLDVTPMFDLSPMLVLLEWSAAADRFNRTGDSRYFATLARQQRKNLALASGGDKTALQQVGFFGNLADNLTNISQNLQLIRPLETLSSAAGLTDNIEKAKPVLQSTAAVRPLQLLLDTIEDSYTPLGLKDPLQTDNLPELLEKQRCLMNWHAEREQWVQAVTLAREWLVSWFLIQLHLHEVTNKEIRERVEHVVNSEAFDLRTCRQTKRAFTPLFLSHIPQVEEVLDLWNTLADVRNDVDHAGMRPHPRPANSLIVQIREILETLDTLPV